MKPLLAGCFSRDHLTDAQGWLNLDATADHADALIESGVTGIIFLGSLGENQSHTAEEKRRAIETMVQGGQGPCHGAQRRRRDEHGRSLPLRARCPADGTSTASCCCRRCCTKAIPGKPWCYLRRLPRRLDCRSWSTTIRSAMPTTSRREMFAELTEVQELRRHQGKSGDTRRITDLRNRWVTGTDLHGVDDLVLEVVDPGH